MSVRTEGYIYNRQKMPIKHGLAHEQAQKKSTIWCTSNGGNEHDLAHDETQKRARFGARRNAENR